MKEFEELSVQQLDRFVDGELSEGERRDVLLATDREVDGWRRLALAFVESQTLRREMSNWMKPLPKELGGAKHRSATGSVRGGLLRMGALVACSLMAFGLGRWTSSAGEQIARDARQPTSNPRTFANDNAQGNDHLIADAASGSQRHETLRVVFEDDFGGPPQAVDVPVLDESEGDPTEILTGPPAISPEVQRALLRAGRRVLEQRQLWEVQLSDGRRGVVPVSNVLVENAGLDVFQ